MSISSKLSDMTTAISSAYTAVSNKGGTVPGNACLNNLPTAIGTIPSGGGAVVEKQLNFYDFEGTLVASYAGNEIQGLSALPSAPDHSGDDVPLTFDEWNWTLAQIKAYNTSYPESDINVGANYHTTDGKTHFFFNITADNDGNGVQFIASSSGTVNWGDGTTGSFSTSMVNHVYSAVGLYHAVLTTNATSISVSNVNAYTTDRKLNSKLKHARLSSKITKLKDNAFYSCCTLESVSIPKNATSIEKSFQECYSIRCVVVPKGVTSIGYQAFYNCKMLQMLALPNSITSFGENALRGCHSIPSLTIPSGVTSFGKYSLSYMRSLRSITMPSGVTSFGNYVTQESNSILNATVYSSSVWSYAFNSCIGMKSVSLKNNVTSINSYAFAYCYSLCSVAIPDGVTSIGTYAFYSCYSLQGITLPSTVTSIGANAFDSCNSLYSITLLGTTPPTLSNTNAISTINTKKIYVPSSAVSTYKSASNWSTFSSIIEAIPS